MTSARSCSFGNLFFSNLLGRGRACTCRTLLKMVIFGTILLEETRAVKVTTCFSPVCAYLLILSWNRFSFFFCVFFFCFRRPPNVPQNNKGVLAPLSNPQPPFKGGPPHLTGGSLCTPKPLRGAHHHARCARVPAGNPLNPPSSLSFCLPGRGI